MSSLADLAELVGFFSYSREDDMDSFGALSTLRSRVQAELRGQLGRTVKTFRLWQDKEAIPSGTLWESEIKNAVAQSVFFIPIITPTVVASPYCMFELEAFLARETELRRNDLVFPILYIDVPSLEDSTRQQNDPILSLIARRQYVDWRQLRHQDARSTEVSVAVERFCKDIRDALYKPWLSPQERKEREQAEAQRDAETERQRQEVETEARAKEAEARQRAEAVARSKRKADDTRVAAHGTRAGAEKRRREEERGKPAEAKPHVRDAKQPEGAASSTSKWPFVGILAHDRARFAVGAMIFMNAAWWLAVAVPSLRHSGLTGDLAILVVIVGGGCAVGMLTMYGMRQVKWLAIGMLCVGTINGVGEGYERASYARNIYPGNDTAGLSLGIVCCVAFLAAGIAGIVVCLNAWRPMRNPPLSRLTGTKYLVVLFLFLVFPFWSLSFLIVENNGAIWQFSKPSELFATFASIYAFCVLLSVVCSRIWAAKELVGTS
jgi:hypothetical protein